MDEKIAIIYAHRDRDTDRIRFSFESLQKQSAKNFEVIFVDYGSGKPLTEELEKLMGEYEFVTSYFLPVPHLLWNKSKALNYGIIQSSAPYIFIADVDLIFHPEAIENLNRLKNSKSFCRFKMGYLDRETSSRLNEVKAFETLKPSRVGEVNGMVLAPKEAFLKVNGFDEFFHFYGAEDVDLFFRLASAGYDSNKIENVLFYHIWHPSFHTQKEKDISTFPSIINIMRLNHRHYLRNKELNLIRPRGQDNMGEILPVEKSRRLNHPTMSYKVLNKSAHVDHFLKEELPSLHNEIVKVDFILDPDYNTVKFKIKKVLGKLDQPYYSLKEVNDKVLEKILHNYRNDNYSFKISPCENAIEFKIEV